ncbi:MAG: glycosyltransferase [Fibromonadaceae bacterium]|jgi:glycosyltransferase involved in cell wall biosynthesis|nr:glycosyltransferase [Fibromonadaceae bacterium]
MHPLISVIVPVYNVERYIHKCVNSILAQTYTNLEIILVDDGSPDNCGKICDEYATNNPKIKVIHKENGGLSDARNAGLDIAKGELICFVDSDDWCEKDMLQIAFEAMENSKCDIIAYGAFHDFIQNEKVFRTVIKSIKREQKISSFDESLPLLIKDFLTVTAWNKLYKKKIFKNLRFPKGKLFEDVWIFPKLFENCNGMLVINKPLYHYAIRNNGNSIMASFNLKKMENLEALKSWQDFEKNGNLSKIILMQNAWYLLIKIEEQNKKENKVYSEQIIKLLMENSQYVKISSFYDSFFSFLILKKFNYEKVLFFRKKIRQLFLFMRKLYFSILPFKTNRKAA